MRRSVHTLVAFGRSSTCRRPGWQHWGDWLSWRWRPLRLHTPQSRSWSEGPARAAARTRPPLSVWAAEWRSHCWRTMAARTDSSWSSPALWRGAPAIHQGNATATPKATDIDKMQKSCRSTKETHRDFWECWEETTISLVQRFNISFVPHSWISTP